MFPGIIAVKAKILSFNTGNKKEFSLRLGPAEQGSCVYFIIPGKKGKDNGMILPGFKSPKPGGGFFPLPAKSRGIKEAEFFLYGKPDGGFGKEGRFLPRFGGYRRL
jgi:hypothetical protein